ncbi:Na+/H+ antiporter NhaC family protein [Paenibacillus sp.]|uniref:Na+/H+ antiporter NhaC family protein n=1 Tax=Paenibacillus sp. TaxID=58172 RepID=UPI002D3D2C21|nr:Na+/H+ antiporter NhaC family protein [Paenibacillus sp.]HZG55931.1 Na+/H+ antiporter NhaC family protein [Paenibacillus sp.]
MGLWRMTGIVGITAAGLGAAYAAELPLAAGFSLGLAALMAGALRSRAVPGWAALGRMMREGVAHTKEVVWILLLVGLLIPAWTAGGVVEYLVAAGLSLLDPAWIVTFGFAFASAIAMVLGTSTGTLSAVGIPLMGIAAHLGVPLPLMAGALVSGAFVGDRTSPFSSAHQLVASSAGVPERALFRLLRPTTYAGFALALAVFAAFDRIGAWGRGGEAGVGVAYSGGGDEHWLLAVPPALLLICILVRLRTRHAFVVGIVSGVAVGAYVQGGTVQEWIGWLWHGYAEPGGSGAGTSAAAHGKGLAAMIELVALIALAGAYNGIMENAGLVRPIAARVLGAKPTLAGATARTGLFGLGLSLVSCTQTLPIMMTARSLSAVWVERFPREHLARVTADTSLLLAALVPWNMIAVLCGTILGVGAERYAPYALFLWVPPLLTVGWSAWSGSRRQEEQVGGSAMGR